MCSKPQYSNIISAYNNTGRFPIANGKLLWCAIHKTGTQFLDKLRRQGTFEKSSANMADHSARPKQFLFVREPYSRLLSGYVSKHATHPFWYDHAVKVKNKYALEESETPISCGHNLTFPDFVKYFIGSELAQNDNDGHFIPMHRLGDVCRHPYEYIGHLETMVEDLRYLMDIVDVNTAITLDSNEQTIRAQCKEFVEIYEKYDFIKKCQTKCGGINKIWWSFHLRGVIDRNVDFPMKGDLCERLSGEEFTEIAIDAYHNTKGKFDKRKQKLDFMTELFLQVPLVDRLKVRHLLAKDFELWDYDPQPDHLFPELVLKHA